MSGNRKAPCSNFKLTTHLPLLLKSFCMVVVIFCFMACPIFCKRKTNHPNSQGHLILRIHMLHCIHLFFIWLWCITCHWQWGLPIKPYLNTGWSGLICSLIFSGLVTTPWQQQNCKGTKEMPFTWSNFVKYLVAPIEPSPVCLN